MRNSCEEDNPSIEEVMKLTSPTDARMIPRQKKRVLELARKFNQVAGSDRPLIGGFYDCGTTARAIFMHLVDLHRPHGLMNRETDSIYLDYKPGALPKKLSDAMSILENMEDGVMILTIRFWYDPELRYQDDRGPNRVLRDQGEKQFGHVWVIEKRDENYYIYQSSLNEYRTIDHYMTKGALLAEGGPGFLAKLEPLIKAKTWSLQNEELFMDYFDFVPENVPIGLKVRPEFFYAYVEY